MFGILGGQERALVMIEPPGQPGIAGIFEVHNGVLIAVEELRLEHLRRLVHHARIGKFRVGVEHAFHEAAEEGRRSRAVEAVIVIEDAEPHELADGRKPNRLH